MSPHNAEPPREWSLIDLVPSLDLHDGFEGMDRSVFDDACERLGLRVESEQSVLTVQQLACSGTEPDSRRTVLAATCSGRLCRWGGRRDFNAHQHARAAGLVATVLRQLQLDHGAPDLREQVPRADNREGESVWVWHSAERPIRLRLVKRENGESIELDFEERGYQGLVRSSREVLDAMPEPGDPAEHARILSLPSVEPTCDWREVRRGRLREALFTVASLSSLPWDDTFGPPQRCLLRMNALPCAPDLNGDGAEDTLVGLHWTIPLNEHPCTPEIRSDPLAEYWEGEALVALTGRRGRWRPLGIVTYSMETGQGGLEPHVEDYVRLRDGRVAFRGTSTSFDTAYGFECTDAWVGVLEDGLLRRVMEVRNLGCGYE